MKFLLINLILLASLNALPQQALRNNLLSVPASSPVQRNSVVNTGTETTTADNVEANDALENSELAENPNTNVKQTVQSKNGGANRSAIAGLFNNSIRRFQFSLGGPPSIEEEEA